MSGPDSKEPQDKAPAKGARRLPPRVERRIGIARILLVWETLWPALWPPVGLAGIFLSLALFGAFQRLPMALHWALLGASALLMAWLVWRGLMGLRWPDRDAALRHLERVSGLAHRPLAAYEDLPAPGSGDAALWRAHQNWVADRLRKLRLGLPSPGLATRDPYALRAIVAMLLVVALAGTGDGRMRRVASALLPGVGAAKTLSIEAWVTPPAYTGRAPIYLSRAEPGGTPANGETLTVPVNSVFSIRVHGPRNPPALQSASGERGERSKPELLEDTGDRNYVVDTKLADATEFALTVGGRVVRSWNIAVIPDEKPTIALTKPIEKTATGSLRFAYKVHDDYGVVSAEARIALVAPPPPPPAISAPKPRPGAAKQAAHAKPVPHVTPPVIKLALPTLRPRDASGETYVDLTPHPWAGLPVTITLVAEDDAKQEGVSEPVAMTLPARDFRKPLAAAIVEQRRALALDPASTPRIASVIDAFTHDAERYIDDTTVYLALRSAYWRLTSAGHESDLNGIFDLLWATALHIEDGDLSLAESDLRRTRDALNDALARGAGNDEIERLLDELKESFKRYMDSLAARGGNMPNRMEQFAPRDGQTIDRDQLEKMLSAISELARTGAREQAKAMLEQLQAIMENMRVPQQGNEAMSESEQAMAQGVDRMGKLIDRQRQLMDETFRQSGQGGQGGATAGGNGTGGKAGGKHAGKSLEELKRAQEALRQELDGIIRDLGKSGAKVPSSLDKAGRSMESAGERLGEGRADRATGAQGQAIAGLREGAQGLADQLMQSMAGRRGTTGRGNGNNMDPLGRSLPSSGTDLGADVAVPDKIDIQRAREIIEELRRRAGELGRPKIELDYLDRLLKRF